MKPRALVAVLLLATLAVVRAKEEANWERLELPPYDGPVEYAEVFGPPNCQIDDWPDFATWKEEHYPLYEDLALRLSYREPHINFYDYEDLLVIQEWIGKTSPQDIDNLLAKHGIHAGQKKQQEEKKKKNKNKKNKKPKEAGSL